MSTAGHVSVERSHDLYSDGLCQVNVGWIFGAIDAHHVWYTAGQTGRIDKIPIVWIERTYESCMCYAQVGGAFSALPSHTHSRVALKGPGNVM